MALQRASRTAEYMALFRALESARPPGERLFADPFAAGFLRWPLRLVAFAARLPPLRRLSETYIDRRWPGARTSGIARTRLIDDAVVQAIRDGARQVVLLGAGFDCRPQRLPAMRAVRVFEADHPATAQAKQQRAPAHAETPITYVSVDLQRDDLRGTLIRAGFDPTVPSFFVCEGVTNYLDAAAIEAMLRLVGSSAASAILFTYVDSAVFDDTSPAVADLFATLRAAGEDWTFGIDPTGLPALLAHCGLQLMEDTGSREYRARYLGKAPHLLSGYEFYRAALARTHGSI